MKNNRRSRSKKLKKHNSIKYPENDNQIILVDLTDQYREDGEGIFG